MQIYKGIGSGLVGGIQNMVSEEVIIEEFPI